MKQTQSKDTHKDRGNAMIQFYALCYKNPSKSLQLFRLLNSIKIKWTTL